MASQEEEVLELIWTAREEGIDSVDGLLRLSEQSDLVSMLYQMEQKGWLSIKKDKVVLSTRGEERANEIIRRHRLAETLLSLVFELDDSQVESTACKFEHILSAQVTESVCAFLGHPRYCPHGKPIPPASCCKKFQSNIRPLVNRLSDLDLGQEGRIVFIAPKSRHRLTQLGSFGIIPGSTVRLLQRQPSYIIRVGQTDIALDSEIAQEIYVKSLSERG